MKNPDLDTGNGATIFGVSGAMLTAEERAFFRHSDPFGFILFARNIESPAQVRALTADLREAVQRDAVITIDQEGGRVQRLRAPHWREWAPALELASKASDLLTAIEIVSLQARLIAAELLELGIDSNCAPVADIAGAMTHPFLHNRCYGTDVRAVTTLAAAIAETYLDAGVLPVIKHMPGHGRARADSHKELPRVDADADTLHRVDFAPFRALRDLPMAMTAHILFTALDPNLPATQSPEMIRIIREEIGFKGLLMTDDLNMQALSGDVGTRTARAMAAGCDVALHCSGDLAEMTQVAAAAGDLTTLGRSRAQGAIARRHSAAKVDLAALDDAFLALTQG